MKSSLTVEGRSLWVHVRVCWSPSHFLVELAWLFVQTNNTVKLSLRTTENLVTLKCIHFTHLLLTRIILFLQICKPLFLLCYWRSGQWTNNSGNNSSLRRTSWQVFWKCELTSFQLFFLWIHSLFILHHFVLFPQCFYLKYNQLSVKTVYLTDFLLLGQTKLISAYIPVKI